MIGRSSRASGSWAILVLGGVLSSHSPLLAQVTPQEESRPDSVRAMVLDRIREQGVNDTEPGADTVSVEIDRDENPQSVAEGSQRPAGGITPADLPAGADSIMQALAELAGFSAASYEGDRVDFDAGARRLVLWGTEESRARFSGQGVRLEADSTITYEDRLGRVRTSGPSDLTPETGEPLSSELLIYDLVAQRGTAIGAETTYSQGAQWIVRGDLDSVEEDLLFGTAARFTTCDLPDPHSFFRAAELKVINNQVLVARSVRMYVDDVPVLWLPFIAQNLGRGRASGILTPTFSINDVFRTSTSYNRRVSNMGYYWAMSQYSDMTVAFDWFSDNYTALQGGIRYRWARQFLDGGLNVKRYWRGTGQQELGLDTNHQWNISERTSVRASGRYISSSTFVRQNSLDPRESTATVDSDATLSRRFNWGQLTLGSSRKQYLNEDRTETTLPSASLSLATMTLFAQPNAEAARWYNNLSVSGSMSWDRRIEDREMQADSMFNFGLASKIRTEGSARGNMSLGDLSLRGSLTTRESVFEAVPGALAILEPVEIPAAPSTGQGDFRSGDLEWSTGLSYQQDLIGSTTLTPTVSIEGSMLRVDSIPEAREFIAGTNRIRAGATLQTDIYGFYPGFGRFETIRHKITPSVSWSYAPEVTPTELQARVFGPTAARTQNAFTVGFNQTWEAKVSEPEPDASVPDSLETVGPARPGEDSVQVADSAQAANGAAGPDEFQPAAAEETPGGAQEPAQAAAGDDDALGRLPPTRNIVLLGLQTNAITYDLIEADSTGNFIDGFRTLSLGNRVSSDYLQGLNLSFTHDLFDDSGKLEGGAREFSPHLSQLSVGFTLDERSGLLRAFAGLLGIETDPEPEPGAEEEEPELDLEEVPDAPLDQFTGFDSNRVIPGEDPRDRQPRREGWEADIDYSLTRPRGAARGSALRAQMVRSRLSFTPSENWTVDWSTSYDVEARHFNDHVVNLRRDLHEWEANFSFVQTATGNWSFQFEVALKANQDLKFDYRQRSLEAERIRF